MSLEIKEFSLEKEKVFPDLGMNNVDRGLELAEIGPITDLERLKYVAEAIETAKNKKNCELNKDENTDTEETFEEESEMTINDSDFDMTVDDSELGEESEEVMFPPISHESSMSEDSADELEQIREQILMDNDKSDEEGKIREQLFNDDEQMQTKQACSELEKIQLQILVDNIQAAEAITKVGADKTSELSKEPVQPQTSIDTEKNLELFKEPVQPMKKINTYAWKESESLPKGWKLKKTRKMSFEKELLLSPGEYIFCCRREALKSLIDNNSETDEVECMRSKLKYEGWKENENLPQGWKFRKTKLQTFFCSENGILLKSCKEALGRIRDYHQEIAETFLSAFKVQVSKDEQREGWEASDSVPTDWKIRRAEGKTNKMFFLSPQGIQFSSRVKALQYLVKEKYDEDEISVMRSTLSHEKYTEDQNLPVGWTHKKLISRNQTLILTSFGDILDSFKKVMLYTQYLGIHSSEDICKLEVFSKPNSSESKSSKFTWKDDSSVPVGWKVRTARGKIVSLLDPHGNQFKTRRAGLQHLIKNKAGSKLIEEVHRCLVHEGWNESINLPSGWMFKKNRKNIFLSREGILIKEDKNAISYIKRRIPKNYSLSDLENMKSFIQTRNNTPKGKNLLWIDDPTIPNGWKTRKSNAKSGRNFFLSPDGSKFQSRKKAYLHMIKQKYPKDELAAMRDKLSVEGWEENELLPEGWIFKIKEAYEELVFITTEGLTFRDSKLKVLEFVKASENYNEGDAEGIDMFYEIEYSRRIAEKYEWIDSDETVPEGWKYRYPGSNNEKKYFLSPEGRTFQNRIAALKHIVTSDFPEKDIDAMRSTFSFEGWNDDELLPKGWKYKVQAHASKWTINLLSREAHEFNDIQIKVSEFLTSANGYTEDDAQRMEMFYEIENNKQRKLKYEWLEDEEVVPFGWKFRVLDGKKSKMYFLSPDGHEFSSRHSALQHMISSSYQEEEIEEMRNSLGAEGWVMNNFLPPGWRFKNSATEKKFMARGGEIIRGFSAALASIGENEDYDDYDVMNLHKLQGGKELTWMEDDDTVPYGWKVSSSNSKSKQSTIMSPDGVQFASRILAFQHLIKTDTDELEVEDMREKLVHEGWNDSTYLPPGWIFRNSKGNVNLLSKEGDVYVSNQTIEAIEFMRNSSVYTEDDVDRLNIFLKQEACAVDEKSPNEWMEDDTVPDDWKIKLKDTKNYGKTSFLSPNGISYPSRKTALQSMLGSGSSEEEVSAMRKLLSNESWKESELLPVNWLYKLQASTFVLILTDTGKELKSKESVMDVLKFSKHDIENIEMFFEMISVHKRLMKYEWEEYNESVPEGWKLRSVEGNSTKSSFLSPSGTAYPSRKIALQSLINCGASDTEIDIMRKKLVHEGWKESDLLPDNWVYKLFGVNGLIVISEDGKEIKSKETTLDYMKNSGKEYSHEDFDRMNMFFEMIFAQKRMMKYEWKEDDESVPAGWKVNNKNSLLSPDGTSYASRKLALKALIKNERTQQEIEEMRGKLSYEGWKTSDMLPEKWLYKRFGSKSIKIVTSEGVEIKDSKQNAIGVMKAHQYSKDDLERLETFFEMVYAEGRLSSIAWQEDSETLPKGWKYRVQIKSGKNNFLCPEGLPFSSRKAGYQHMVEAKYNPAEIEDMRRKLIHESWQFHDLLPQDWLYKVLQYGTRNIICILTSEGTEMKDSKLMVTDFMRSVDRYDGDDVDKLGKFFEMEGGKKLSVKQEKQEWFEGCPTLPHGWKFRKGEGAKEYFLSPDNFQFTSRSKSLKHMVSTKFYTEQQINEMRDFLKVEGWAKKSDLPLHWLFKENSQDNKTPVILITPEGEVLESMKAGLDVIKDIYRGEDVIKMQRFIQEHSASYKNNIKQEIIVNEMDYHQESDLKETMPDEEYVCNVSDTGVKEVEEDDYASKVVINMPLIKQEVITIPPKSGLDTAELETILANGNFNSSVVKQINNERKRSYQELDMAELDSVLTEGNFTSDIIGQIMRKMNNPNSTINLQSISMQENKKRKSEEWEGELRRFRKRFC